MDTFYATTQDGRHLENPDPVAIGELLASLGPAGNCFVVLYPEDEDMGWSVAVTHHDGEGLSGRLVERHDPYSGGHSATLVTDSPTLGHDVWTWATTRLSTPMSRGTAAGHSTRRVATNASTMHDLLH